MSAAGEYRPGDSGYSDIYAKWVAEGSANEFEILGDEGGARWRTHNRDATAGPTFLMIAAAGPTSTGYDETTEKFKTTLWKGPRKGYEFEARDVGLEVGQGPTAGQMEIRVAAPPRDLAAMKSIVAELEDE